MSYKIRKVVPKPKDLSPWVEVLDLGTNRLMDLEERRVRTGL